MRLNVGCGKRRLPGYIGIDVTETPATDYVADIRHLPFSGPCADEVLAVHVVEHFYAWEVPELLAEWARVLVPGGRLHLEMPDLLKAARNLAESRRLGKHPDQAHMWAIYGDDTLRNPLMMHKSGWWFARLKPVVEAAGFGQVVERDTIFHPVGRGERDFRLEAVRQ